MNRLFVLRPRAENDIRSAYEWYESQRRGLGEEFLAAVRQRLEQVQEFPEAHTTVYRNVRRAVVSRFPYLIFYVARSESTTVLAVLHHARNPAVWPKK
jgi:toxin ParE1/3/4